MITLHCQCQTKEGRKCPHAVAAIINGVLVLSYEHNGEKHTTPVTLADIEQLIKQDKERRDQPLRQI